MLTLVLAVTGLVVTAKVALVAPGAAVTEGGTLAAAGLSLDKLITAPARGAGPFSVRVPVEEPPPPTLDGDRLSPARPTLRL
jgi:hypothetical protein